MKKTSVHVIASFLRQEVIIDSNNFEEKQKCVERILPFLAPIEDTLVVAKLLSVIKSKNQQVFRRTSLDLAKYWDDTKRVSEIVKLTKIDLQSVPADIYYTAIEIQNIYKVFPNGKGETLQMIFE